MKHMHKPGFGTILFLYVIAQGGLFFILNTVYWDDWMHYRSTSEVILERYRQHGVMLNAWGYLHASMLALGPWIYKILVFGLALCSGLLLNLIVKRHAGISSTTRFTIVLLFLVLPFNSSRVLLAIFPYMLCQVLFFLAWYLIDRSRVAALLLFFLSFNTNSFLVFYLLPIADLFFRSGHKINVKSIRDFVVKKIDFLVLPFFYFVLKTIYFRPSGIYLGYNEDYGVKKIFKSPVLQFLNFFEVEVSLGLFIAFFLLSLFLLRKLAHDSDSPAMTARGAGIGLLVFLLGALPYWILGRVPTFNYDDWSTRHQLLLPLGAAICIAFLLARRAAGEKRILLSMVVGLSLAMNVTSYLSYYINSKKQQQVVDFLRQDPLVSKAGLVVFDDQSTARSLDKRRFQIYEWNGLLESAFHDQRRFGINPHEIKGYLEGEFDGYFSPLFKAGDFSKAIESPPVLVTINWGRVDSRDLGFRTELFKDQALGVFYPEFRISSRVINDDELKNLSRR